MSPCQVQLQVRELAGGGFVSFLRMGNLVNAQMGLGGSLVEAVAVASVSAKL